MVRLHSLLAPLLLLVSACAFAPRPRPGFVAIYRWQVKPGCEHDVERAWRVEAERYRDRYGSLGARLHRADDGSYVSTAFWSSRGAWGSAPRPIDTPDAERVLDACITQKVEELHMIPVVDATR